MTKLTLILMLVAGCGMQYDGVDVIPDRDGPLLTGGDESFKVLQNRSSQFSDPDVVVPEHLTVTVADDRIARLASIDHATGTFVLHGVAPGTTHVTVTGNDAMTADQVVVVAQGR